jgi:hypothetical protein
MVLRFNPSGMVGLSTNPPNVVSEWTSVPLRRVSLRDHEVREGLLRKVDRLLSREARTILEAYREFPYGQRFLSLSYVEETSTLWKPDVENTSPMEIIRYDRYWYSYIFQHSPLHLKGSIMWQGTITVHKNLILANFRDRWYGVHCEALTKVDP